MRILSPAGDTSAKWPGCAAALWGLVFAVPSFVWALGYTFGARSTVAPDLVRMAREQVPWFVAVLWITGILKLFGTFLGLGLTGQRGRRLGCFLVFCGAGAAVLLVWHGALFIVHGVLVEAGTIAVKPDLAPLTRWYLYLWGPWFVLGGLAFGLASIRYLRSSGDPRVLVRCGVVGALGAALISLGSTVSGIG